jgi:hypothetical protein
VKAQQSRFPALWLTGTNMSIPDLHNTVTQNLRFVVPNPLSPVHRHRFGHREWSWVPDQVGHDGAGGQFLNWSRIKVTQLLSVTPAKAGAHVRQ